MFFFNEPLFRIYRQLEETLWLRSVSSSRKLYCLQLLELEPEPEPGEAGQPLVEDGAGRGAGLGEETGSVTSSLSSSRF